MFDLEYHRRFLLWIKSIHLGPAQLNILTDDKEAVFPLSYPPESISPTSFKASPIISNPPSTYIINFTFWWMFANNASYNFAHIGLIVTLVFFCCTALTVHFIYTPMLFQVFFKIIAFCIFGLKGAVSYPLLPNYVFLAPIYLYYCISLMQVRSWFSFISDINWSYNSLHEHIIWPFNVAS